MIGKISEWIQNLRRNKKISYGFRDATVEPNSPNINVQWADTDNSGAYSKTQKKDDRIVMKPKDIVNNLLDDDKIDLNFVNIDAKITAIKKRLKVMQEVQLVGGDEKQALEYLYAQKRYSKIKKGFNWQPTTHTKIKELCTKYKVREAEMNGYHRCIPAEALEQIEAYLKIYRKVTDNKEPKLKLIIDDEEVVKDPILLASSPFGNWWYILGAWDKEVEIMDKLFLR